MCGIVGYIGRRDVQPILLNGLSKLEYRGYDSAGIAVLERDQIKISKVEGRLANLSGQLDKQPLKGSAGIGHTRWATHGKPSDANSHPHADMSGKFTIVHNGIVENYMELKKELEQKGVTFASETDTEVIAHLLAEQYEGDIVAAMRMVIQKLHGAFSLGVMAEHEPDKLVAVRQSSPLVIGAGQGENFIASDISALIEHTRKVYILEDGDLAVITSDHISIMKAETGEAVDRKLLHIDWSVDLVEKGQFEHFMLKEIHEQPLTLRNTMLGRINDRDEVSFPELAHAAGVFKDVDKIFIVACGTAYHAGLIGSTIIEKLTRIPVQSDIASEFRYRDPIITDRTLVIVVSQSGETADTLAALQESRRNGAKILAITNVPTSSIARDADYVIATKAGPEIAVASTKAYTAQLLAFYLFSIYLAQERQTLDQELHLELVKGLKALPVQVEKVLENANEVKLFAESIKDAESLFFIGRGLDYAVALEGSLKLKEISYIHSEAYAAGELKHGTLALIEKGTPVIALATHMDLYEKTVSNIKEVKARGAHVMGITVEGNVELLNAVDEICFIPPSLQLLAPILAVVPLQLISYYASLALGNDIDKPRNLAKSVTVE
ncbi:glutamine--fructose-6-phosphate transaminase (isomerizing) [Paenibacillus radicis (ex Xue et al. 2023)]|uniref:Glutamine--fructose-6-phosphate aminotransferase [isomerizing] n=1 Tax=Paenibacillus radicis (ex Xue et al. 2023) TaxID=2972489 RepID=A0ABT1YTV6_9BACL|nr:glutamine--fructose-6-phosphate transaminase (isomerizing) [Paenibacillus radicis (ex Xue et al. 2023)]MCR8636618.1 glutamine--fructose-6-phosphate transaminase (isomerizing) [Paenibacillus radicis (ex Xue et al. 2023)]